MNESVIDYSFQVTDWLNAAEYSNTWDNMRVHLHALAYEWVKEEDKRKQGKKTDKAK